MPWIRLKDQQNIYWDMACELVLKMVEGGGSTIFWDLKFFYPFPFNVPAIEKPEKMCEKDGRKRYLIWIFK